MSTEETEAPETGKSLGKGENGIEEETKAAKDDISQDRRGRRGLRSAALVMFNIRINF